MADTNLALTVAHSPPSSSVGESPELLQSRLRVFAGLMAGIMAAIYLVGFAIVWIFFPHQLVATHLHPVKLMNAAAGLVLVALWLYLGRRALDLRVLQTLDVSLALGIALAALMALKVPLGFVAVLGALLIIVFTLALRAALVPSPPRRTALIALTAVAPLVFGAYQIAGEDPTLPSFMTPGTFAVGVGLWGGALVAATTITSKVIYGLHREVEKTRRLGQYTLVEKIGEGGMGSVYLARHAMLRRPTALKLLAPDRAGTASVARFEREVQLTSMLTHPNTVAIYDFGRTTDGIFYYAMEYADGATLEDIVRAEGAQSPARVVHVLRQVAGALGEAHRVGLIHRDVKPANILLCERGGVADTVKVVDFGLVKELATDTNVTQADTITGTPAYLAPEMITAPNTVDGRTDLYGLGAVGYFMLTGTTVFDAATVVEVCGHHLHTKPEPPSARRGEPLPAELEQLILQCLAKRPDDRPADAAALEHALAELGKTLPWTNRDATAWWQEWRKSKAEGGDESERSAREERRAAPVSLP